ncbi:MAG: CPBP family intramembrane metalloprotease [Krumholzibacteria bacterium]|nr:CPBP family intramembrane metalloprotease [Candidatus Krumholzibacteria bacterium]
MADPYFAAVALLLAVVIPLSGVWDYRRLRAWTAAGRPDARLRTYRWVMGQEWVLTVALLVGWQATGRGAADLLLVPRADGWQWLWLGLGLAAAGLLVVQMNAVLRSSRHLAELRGKLGDLELMAPRGPAEIRAFDRLSFTAGICEEILYRGILLGLLAGVVGTWPAVAVTSLVFSLGHLYQGPAGLAKTAAVGLVLGALAVLSGSLYAPMALHAAIDLTSGRMMGAAMATEGEPAA